MLKTNWHRLLASVVLSVFILLFQNCGVISGFKTNSSSSTFSSLSDPLFTTPAAAFQDLSATVPSRITTRVSAIYNHLKSREQTSLVTCWTVSVTANQSLSNAVNAAIAAHGAGAYCLQPGNIDKQIDVLAQVELILMPGTYTQSALIVMHSLAALLGASAATTVLSYAADLHGTHIQIADYGYNIYVGGLTLTRATPGSAASDSAITTGVSGDEVIFEDLLVSSQYDGLHLGPMGIGWVRNIVITGSQHDGVLITNPGGGACQYFLRDILVALSTGYGIYVSPDGGGMSVENWDGIMTYANKGGGIRLPFLGGADIVYALRMDNSFLLNDGENGTAALIIENGYGHKITNTVIDQAGASASGVQQPGVAGIQLLAAASTVTLRNVLINHSSGAGLQTAASDVLTYGVTFADNGLSGSSVTAGNVQFINDLFTNAGGTQSSGISSQVSSLQILGSSADLLKGSALYTGPAPTAPLGTATGTAGMQAIPAFTSPGPITAASACIQVSPTTGQSLATATQAAIQSGGAGSYCLTAGTIDSALHLPSNVVLLLAPGTYNQSASIYIDGSGAGIIGTSPGSTVLNFLNGQQGANIIVSNGVDSYQVTGLMLTRNGAIYTVPRGSLPAADGDDGIITGTTSNQGFIDNLVVLNQFDGLYMESAQEGWIRNTIVSDNARMGILVTNLGTTNGAAGYHMRDVLLESNASWGIYLSPDGGNMAPGLLEGILTFYNGNGNGGIVAVKSNAGAVNGLQMSNLFLGDDGGNGNGAEILILGGTGDQISDVHIEASGIGPSGTGPNTPAISLASAVSNITIAGLYSGPNPFNALVSSATNLFVVASTMANCGLTPVNASDSAGAYIIQGSASFYGDLFSNSSGTQKYGVLSLVAGINLSGSYSDGLNGMVLYSGQ